MRRRLIVALAAVFLLTSFPQIEVRDRSALNDTIGALVQHPATEHRGLDEGGMHIHYGGRSGVVVLISIAEEPLLPVSIAKSCVDSRHPLPWTLLAYSRYRPPARHS